MQFKNVVRRILKLQYCERDRRANRIRCSAQIALNESYFKLARVLETQNDRGWTKVAFKN